MVIVTVSHGHPTGTGYILVTMTKLNNRTYVFISVLKKKSEINTELELQNKDPETCCVALLGKQQNEHTQEIQTFLTE